MSYKKLDLCASSNSIRAYTEVLSFTLEKDLYMCAYECHLVALTLKMLSDGEVSVPLS